MENMKQASAKETGQETLKEAGHTVPVVQGPGHYRMSPFESIYQNLKETTSSISDVIDRYITPVVLCTLGGLSAGGIVGATLDTFLIHAQNQQTETILISLGGGAVVGAVSGVVFGLIYN